MDVSIFNTVKNAFGKVLAARLIACAMLNKESMERAAEWDEETAVRYTIGMVKRMRRQSIENGQNMTWESAIERLENEQVEGRHYTFKGSLSRAFGYQVRMESERNEWADVETFKRSLDKGTDMWSVKVEVEAERMAEVQNESDVNAVDAKVWVETYMATLTAKRRAWFSGVLSAYRRGDMLTKLQSTVLSNRYTPEGVKPSEFMELVVRYA